MFSSKVFWTQLCIDTADRTWNGEILFDTFYIKQFLFFRYTVLFLVSEVDFLVQHFTMALSSGVEFFGVRLYCGTVSHFQLLTEASKLWEFVKNFFARGIIHNA